MVPTSTGELRRVADSLPSVTPTIVANARANSVSSSVTGSRSIRISLTGRPCRSETPRSPVASWPR